MTVFLSWSGEASRGVAEVLRRYLPFMIQGLRPFMSQHDLASGVRWSEQLSKELEHSNFGVVCLTPENLHSPWILFEAGALTKHVEGRACCLLFRGLQPADVTGPLAQFQNRVFARDEFEKLLSDINEGLESKLESGDLKVIFNKWWPDVDEEVVKVLADPKLHAENPRKREQLDVIEEILRRVRSIQRGLEENLPAEQLEGYSTRTLRETLDEAIAELSPNELSALRELVTPSGVALVGNRDDLEAKFGKEAIKSLFDRSFVIVGENDRIMVVHDLVAKYLSETLFAPSGGKAV